jgi:hypothetical protein
VSKEGDNTILNIEIEHNNPSSSHYVNIIDVEIDGNVQSVTGLEPQTSTQFTYKYDLGKLEYENVRVRANCNVHGWSNWATLGEQPIEGCLIATATYESELSPQVQFLRGFRDNTVLSTFAGSNFMTAFNGFYYSFSPKVALVISENEVLRDIMKVILYPLIGILHLSSTVFSVFSFIPELGVIVAGLIASSLIGIVYFLPIALILSILKKFKASAKIVLLMGFVWVGSLITIFVAELSKYPSMMMVSTGAFVLATISVSTLTSLRLVLKYLIH